MRLGGFAGLLELLLRAALCLGARAGEGAGSLSPPRAKEAGALFVRRFFKGGRRRCALTKKRGRRSAEAPRLQAARKAKLGFRA